MNLPTKDEIKAWLKTYKHSREWLGQQCGGIKLNTVNNWLSTQANIPDGTLALIARLMEDDYSETERRKIQLSPTNQVFSLEVDLPTFRAYSQAAKAENMTLEEWAIHECNEAAGLSNEGSGKTAPLSNGTTGHQ